MNKKSKVKRYNSLEELRSTKEFADGENQINTEKSYSTKNLDRYSWGKAEISFLQSSSTTNTDLEISKTLNNKWSPLSMESLINDSSGFYLVTNKKKAKKKTQLELEEKDIKIHCCTNHNQAKHQLPQEVKANEKKNDKHVKVRRKSFSSVPQSDISDSSDVESVHSLPDSYRKNSSTAVSYLSYAEIIRKNSKSENYHTKNATNSDAMSKTMLKKKGTQLKNKETENMNELLKSNSLSHDLHEAFSNNLQKARDSNLFFNQNKDNEELKRKRKGKDTNPVKNQPAVIMKDCNISDVNELVFGFDINKELLLEDQPHSSINTKKQNNMNEKKYCSLTKENNDSVESLTKKACLYQDHSDNSMYTRIVNIPTKKSNNDLENIVNFVSSGNSFGTLIIK